MYVHTAITHKDLNAVKGGDQAMAEWWKRSGLTGPVILANKDNTVTLANIADPKKLTVAEKRALEVSRRGGEPISGIFVVLLGMM